VSELRPQDGAEQRGRRGDEANEGDDAQHRGRAGGCLQEGPDQAKVAISKSETTNRSDWCTSYHS
jgi:hypothetical protein